MADNKRPFEEMEKPYRIIPQGSTIDPEEDEKEVS
jgi:hypothetical protein